MTKKYSKIAKTLATGHIPNPSDDGITAVTVQGSWDPERQAIGLSISLHRIEPDEKSTTHILTPPDDLPDKETK